jgi:hypothetical protein
MMSDHFGTKKVGLENIDGKAVFLAVLQRVPLKVVL